MVVIRYDDNNNHGVFLWAEGGLGNPPLLFPHRHK